MCERNLIQIEAGKIKNKEHPNYCLNLLRNVLLFFSRFTPTKASLA